MTKEQAAEMLILLSREFRIRVPHLIWNRRNRRGWARLHRHSISVSERCWRGVEASLVHEFAHILAHRKHGPRVNHDERFCYCLRHVATAWYGDAAKYPWHSEYKRVAKFAARALTAQTEQK